MQLAIGFTFFGIFLGIVIGLYIKKPNKQEVDIDHLLKPEFYLVHETLPYLKQGLNTETAQKTVEIIKRIVPVDAVAITDLEQIIGFSGADCEYHRLGKNIMTHVTKEAIETGKVKVITGGQFNCSVQECSCPLKASVIVPLFCEERTIGTLKLYQTNICNVDYNLIAVAKGIGQILSIQIELAEKERQKQLVAKAKLEALQAQIRPHFLFNILNTIIYCSRNDPEQARHLLVELSKFFRKSLNFNKNFIALTEEIEYIKTYLGLEQARFGEKIKININVDPTVENLYVPVLTIQPIVENAVLHGISCNTMGGEIDISIKKKNNQLYIVVTDNGKGIPREMIGNILISGNGTNNGLGLSNIDQRLVSIYGPKYRLRIRSQVNKGTMVLIKIPVSNYQQNGCFSEAS